MGFTDGKETFLTLLLTSGVLSALVSSIDFITHCALVALAYLSIYDIAYKQVPRLPALAVCIMMATAASATLLSPAALAIASIILLLSVFPWQAPYLAPYDGLLCALIIMALPLEHISLFLCATGLFASAMAYALGSQTIAMVPPQWLAYTLCTALIPAG